MTAPPNQPACQLAKTREPPAGNRKTISDETAMPTPTPPKCTDWTCGLAAASPRLSTMAEVKIIVKALATPARKRMTENNSNDDVSPMASKQHRRRGQRRKGDLPLPPRRPAIARKQRLPADSRRNWQTR